MCTNLRQNTRILLLPLLIGVCVASGVSAQTSTPWRPLVVFIHGRAQQERTNADLDRVWFAAFNRGLVSAGIPNLLREEDYVLVKYQDIYRPQARVLCPRDQALRWEALDALVAERAQAEGRLQSALAEYHRNTSELQADSAELMRLAQAGGRNAGARLRDVQAELAAAEREQELAFEAVVESHDQRQNARTAIDSIQKRLEAERAQRRRSFSGRFKIALDQMMETFTSPLAGARPVQDAFLRVVAKDTREYLTNYDVNCATDARLQSALSRAQAQNRPVILVAHSMGSIVAFSLMFHKDVGNPTGASGVEDIRRFITVGSQLGVKNLLAPAIVGNRRAPFPVPRAFGSWVNLRGDDDWIAPRKMSGLYEMRPSPFIFHEFLIPTSPGNPHGITGYLENPATARAIAFAWCAAFPTDARAAYRARKPGACRRVHRDVAVPDGGAKRFPR